MRETVRAIVTDLENRLFLVQHHELNPLDFGKWSTIGGGVEEDDINHLCCLKREIAEEFGNEALFLMQFGEKVYTNVREDRVDHFYHVIYTGNELTPITKEEIFSHAWFTEDAIKGLKTFFDIECNLFKKLLAKHD